jgi:hypothetical protein
MGAGSDVNPSKVFPVVINASVVHQAKNTWMGEAVLAKTCTGYKQKVITRGHVTNVSLVGDMHEGLSNAQELPFCFRNDFYLFSNHRFNFTAYY